MLVSLNYCTFNEHKDNVGIGCRGSFDVVRQNGFYAQAVGFLWIPSVQTTVD